MMMPTKADNSSSHQEQEQDDAQNEDDGGINHTTNLKLLEEVSEEK